MRAILLPSMVAAAALTACAQPVVVDNAAGPVVETRWVSCAEQGPTPAKPAGPDAMALPRLDDDFVPVAAIVCDQSPVDRPGGGSDMVATESRADDIAALVAALRLPDEPPTDQACTMDLPYVAWFVLLDATGRWVRPGIPVDACRKPHIEVRHALRDLKLTRVSSKVIRELVSSQAAATGCSQEWADMVSVEAGSRPQIAGPIAAGQLTLPASGPVRLCVYKVPDSEKGSGKPAGSFVRGGVLSPERRALIEKALVAGPAKACSTHTGRFALLRAVDGTGGETYVELDGCLRILVVNYTGRTVLAQGGPELVKLLG